MKAAPDFRKFHKVIEKVRKLYCDILIDMYY